MQPPIIDIEAAIQRRSTEKSVAKAVAQACRHNGFFMISGHGFDSGLMKEVYATGRAFFELPDEKKLPYVPPSPDVFRGYYRKESRKTGAYRQKVEHGDLKEEFLIGPIDERAVIELPGADSSAAAALKWQEQTNVWPTEPPEFRAVFERFYRGMDELAHEVYRIFALSLDLPEYFFEDKIDHHPSTANWGYYPAQKIPAKPGQLRQHEHTDIGSFTILSSDKAIGGLQVQTADGEWVDAVPPDGVFMINIGDILERWTNGMWRATLHRVVNPPAEYAHTFRQSVGMFHKPNLDAVIECIPSCVAPGETPRFPPVLAGEPMRQRMLASRIASGLSTDVAQAAIKVAA